MQIISSSGNMRVVQDDDGKRHKVFLPAGGTDQDAIDIVAAGEPAYAPNGAQRKREALGDIVAALDRMARRITGEIPAAEQISWLAKEAAARAVDNGTDTAADRALLDVEAGITGETRAALAARIVAKADTYRTVAMQIAGIRRKAEADLQAAIVPAEIRAVKQWARAQVQAILGAL